MRWENLETERCSVARTLSVVGDRWALLVLRDCFLGVRRFEDFQRRLGVSRHVLAERLRKLVADGVLELRPYSERPPRHEYRLTAKGRDLQAVLLAMVAWGDRHMPSPAGPPRRFLHRACGHAMHAVPSCSHCGEPLRPEDIASEAVPEVLPAGETTD